MQKATIHKTLSELTKICSKSNWAFSGITLLDKLAAGFQSRSYSQIVVSNIAN